MHYLVPWMSGVHDTRWEARHWGCSPRTKQVWALLHLGVKCLEAIDVLPSQEQDPKLTWAALVALVLGGNEWGSLRDGLVEARLLCESHLGSLGL